LAAGVSLVVALAFPVGYFAVSYKYTLGSLEAQVQIVGQTLAGLIQANPKLWRYETIRIEELLGRHSLPSQLDTRRIFDLEGKLVAESVHEQGWPTLTIDEDLLYAGTTIGRIEVVHSLAQLLRRSLFLALLGGAIGGVLFRLLPFRAAIEAGRRLQEANDFLGKVMEGSSSAIVVLDPAGRIQLTNGRCAQLCGIPSAELVGSPFERLFRDQALADVSGRLRKIQKEGSEGETLETEVTSHWGESISVEFGARPLLSEGKVSGAVICLDDISERKLAEEDRHRVDKLESVGLLAGGIAHDFNNLLTGILGNLTLAKLAVSPEDKLFRFLDNAEKATNRAADLTKQLLTFAKGGAPIKKRTSLRGLIEESATFTLRGANVRCAFSLPEDLWPCEADEGQLSQVLNNLVINAAQAMPEGGTIALAARNLHLEEGDQLTLPKGNYLKITVQDQGAGIPKELLPKIFNPYFTTKRSGNGLGLATAYSIIKKHDGRLTVDSKLGVGTTFSIYLPALAADPHEVVHLDNSTTTGTGRVLVMDDEELVRETAAAMLQDLGYVVSLARDGAEAITLYRQASTAGVPFAAVILDLTIPGGMGGKETVLNLLEDDPKVKAIVCSGYSEDAVMSDCTAFGFVGVLRKPFRIQELSAALTRLLEPGEQEQRAPAG
jgi:two-component system, cell cycle sensor histidine kinase and response regulator CckA